VCSLASLSATVACRSKTSILSTKLVVWLFAGGEENGRGPCNTFSEATNCFCTASNSFVADVSFSDDSARIQKEQTGDTFGIVRVGLKQPGSP
jgi:hypothetical protein